MPAHLTFVAGAADGAAANEGLSVMGWILCSGLRFGRLVIALAIGLLVIGIAQLRSAPVDVYPEFMPPSVEVQTEALGLSAAERQRRKRRPRGSDFSFADIASGFQLCGFSDGQAFPGTRRPLS